VDFQGLVGVLDGPLDAVAEAHFAGHVQGDIAEVQAVIVGFDSAHHVAVVEVVRQLLAYGRLVSKSLPEQFAFAHVQFVKSRTNLTTSGYSRN
jgi:hypothetical protein